MSVHVRHLPLKTTQRVLLAPRVGAFQASHLTQPSWRRKLHTTGGDARPTQLAVKDNIAVGGQPTTCASLILQGSEIPFTATVAQKLRNRGLSITDGPKAGMDEFGMGSHSTTSPYEMIQNVGPLSGYSAGGSSGGSAVAVRNGAADVALGTDTGGSVRMPAAYTGVVGFKPSYGMLSRWGVVPYANSLDTVGLLARTVAPIRTLVVGDGGLYADHDPHDPTSLPTSVRKRCTEQRQCYSQEDTKRFEPTDLNGLTFGMPLEYNIEELEPRMREGWLAAARQVEALGARVVPVSLPTTRNALSAYYVIAPAEAASNLAKYDGIRYGQRASSNGDAQDGVLYAGTRGTGFGDEVKRRILLGAYTLSSEAIDNYFMQAQKVRRLVRRDFDRVFRLTNPLVDDDENQGFDLSDLDERIELDNKLGPPQVDFLLCPTAPTAPPRLEDLQKQTPLDAYMNDVFTVPASLAGLPAISVPMDIPDSKDGHPASFGGLQLIGQYWDDARLLAVAEAISSCVSKEMHERLETAASLEKGI